VNLQLWEKTSIRNQIFYIERLEDDSYKITSAYTKKVIDASFPASEANVYQYEWFLRDNQRWYIKNCGDHYYKFISKNSGLALDVACNSSENGTNVWHYVDNGTDAQRFKLVAVTKSDAQKSPKPKSSLSPDVIREKMLSMKTAYPEGMRWTNATSYS
jgi:hypothetical protein